MAEPHKIPMEEHFRIMANTAPVLIWITDAEGMVCFLNKSWLDFTGKDMEDSGNKGWQDSIHPDDLAGFRLLNDERFEGRLAYKSEFRLQRWDGNYIWMLANAVPRYNDDGTFAGFTGSCIDIEDLKTAEHTREEFTDVAVHELKTPLTTLMVAAQMLLKLLETDAASALIPDLLHTTTSSLKKLELHMNDLLTMNGGKDSSAPLQKSNINLHKLLHECLGYFDPGKERQFLIQCNEEVMVYADPKKMEQVFMNLLHNIVKYAPEAKKMGVLVEEAGLFLRIIIAHDGTGVAEDILPHLFDRYYHGNKDHDKHTSNFGFGLYSSREIIREHGGDMGAENGAQNGCAFWLTLPVNDTVQN